MKKIKKHVSTRSVEERDWLERVKIEMEARNWNQEKLGEAAGMSQGRVSAIFRYDGSMTWDTIRRIEDASGVPFRPVGNSSVMDEDDGVMHGLRVPQGMFATGQPKKKSRSKELPSDDTETAVIQRKEDLSEEEEIFG